jgi:hypothetical protein
LDYAADIIRHQNENMNGSGFPSSLSGSNIPLGSRILRIVVDYQQIVNGLYFNDEYSPNDALDFMDKYAGEKYDKALLNLYAKFIAQLTKTEGIQYDHLIKIENLNVGMTVSRDLVTNDGLLLITKGSTLSATVIRRLVELQDQDSQQLNIFIEDKTVKRDSE